MIRNGGPASPESAGGEARQSLSRYFAFYNGRRTHEALDYATPEEKYFGTLSATAKAA